MLFGGSSHNNRGDREQRREKRQESQPKNQYYSNNPEINKPLDITSSSYNRTSSSGSSYDTSVYNKPQTTSNISKSSVSTKIENNEEVYSYKPKYK